MHHAMLGEIFPSGLAESWDRAAGIHLPAVVLAAAGAENPRGGDEQGIRVAHHGSVVGLITPPKPFPTVQGRHHLKVCTEEVATQRATCSQITPTHTPPHPPAT